MTQMTQIESPQNPRLKAIKRLQSKRDRAREGRFVAEGEDLIAAAERAGSRAVEGFRVAGSGLGGEDFVDVDERALASVSTLGSGTRVIGVYEQRWAERPRGPLCVYLHGVGDPGNVGTVLRSASAFGASGVALGPDCADPYGPKAVQGEHGRDLRGGDRARGDPSRSCRANGWRSSPTRARPAQPLRKLDGPVTLLIGAEREGLPEEIVAACERTAHIPIEAESLNAAMAATVALYEMTRQADRVAAK